MALPTSSEASSGKFCTGRVFFLRGRHGGLLYARNPASLWLFVLLQQQRQLSSTAAIFCRLHRSCSLSLLQALSLSFLRARRRILNAVDGINIASKSIIFTCTCESLDAGERVTYIPLPLSCNVDLQNTFRSNNRLIYQLPTLREGGRGLREALSHLIYSLATDIPTCNK